MPVTKKKGAIFAIYADSPVQQTTSSSTRAAKASAQSTSSGTRNGHGDRGNHERLLSPIKKTTGKAVPLASRPRRILGVKAVGEASLGGLQADKPSKASDNGTDVIDKGKGKADAAGANVEMPALKIKNAVRAHGHKVERSATRGAPRSQPSINQKPNFAPLLPKTKSTSSKRLFEVLSGASSPARSNSPLPAAGADQGAHPDITETRVGSSSRYPAKSLAKRSRAGPSPRSMSDKTKGLAPVTASRHAASGSGRVKARLFEVLADDIEDKENAAPSPLLDSPASRTRSRTRTGIADSAVDNEQATSPSLMRNGTAKDRTIAGSPGAAKAPSKSASRRVLGDVFVLGDVSQAYGASGDEPEGFKVDATSLKASLASTETPGKHRVTRSLPEEVKNGKVPQRDAAADKDH